MILSHRARRLIQVLWLAWLVSTIVGLVFHDAIASFLVKHALEERGFQCNEVKLHVPLKLPPSPIVLAPTRCGVSEGSMATVELKAPLSVILEGIKPVLMTTDSLEITLRPQPKRDIEMNVLGDLTKLLGLHEPALELMFDVAQLPHDDLPPLLAKRAKFIPGEKPATEFKELRVVVSKESTTVTSPHVHIDQKQAELLGDFELRLKGGAKSANANVQFFNGLKLKIDLTGIETAKPHASFNIGGEVKPQPDAAKVEKKG